MRQGTVHRNINGTPRHGMGKKRMANSGRVVSKFTESNEQIAAMDWLKLQHPEVAQYTMHIGNERKSSFYAGYIMKRMGVLKGASDLFIAWPAGKYHGLFIEVKSKTGKPTIEQIEFIQRVTDKGYYACLCFGAEQVIATIGWYLKLAKKAHPDQEN